MNFISHIVPMNACFNRVLNNNSSHIIIYRTTRFEIPSTYYTHVENIVLLIMYCMRSNSVKC